MALQGRQGDNAIDLPGRDIHKTDRPDGGIQIVKVALVFVDAERQHLPRRRRAGQLGRKTDLALGGPEKWQRLQTDEDKDQRDDHYDAQTAEPDE